MREGRRTRNRAKSKGTWRPNETRKWKNDSATLHQNKEIHRKRKREMKREKGRRLKTLKNAITPKKRKTITSKSWNKLRNTLFEFSIRMTWRLWLLSSVVSPHTRKCPASASGSWQVCRNICISTGPLKQESKNYVNEETFTRILQPPA